MNEKQNINRDKRLLIYRYILKNPYMHFREIARKLQIPETTLAHHLRYLEKNNLIVSKKEGRYNRYCIVENVGNIEKKLLNVFRQDATRNVLLYIMLCMSASQNEIAKELKKDPKTIEVHLKRLLDLDIIEVAPLGTGVVYAGANNSVTIRRKPCKNEILYRVKESMKTYATLIKYYDKKTIDDPIVDLIISYNKFVSPGKSTPKIIKTKKQAVESLEEIIFEVFPHPYYA